MNIKNPICPGFYPDPSVCRAGDKYYLVNSTFAYFPGLPVFESEDLINWKQIGNAIDRESQMTFDDARITRGLFAPTIRYNNGKFYIICTQVDELGNFFITADDPAGPWSDPIAIEGAPGIDPSLFFDDDGTVWYIGTRPAPEGPQWNGNWEIWIQKIDLNTGKLLGGSTGIWRGALKRCIWPEGPHIYKINGEYVLLHAEGGTSIQHAVCVAKADNIQGPWTGDPCNPILTHRNMGKRAAIINVGHGDFVDTPDGKWWMVCLATRPQGVGKNRVSPLGRETFIVPVEFEDGWPLASPDTGHIDNAYTVLGKPVVDDMPASYEYAADFNGSCVGPEWLSLRNRPADSYSLTERKDWLRLMAEAGPLTETGKTDFFGIRQICFDYKLSVDVDFNPEGFETAGIAFFQSELFQYRMEMFSENGKRVRVVKVEDGKTSVMGEQEISHDGTVHMECSCIDQKFTFSIKAGEACLIVAEGCDSTILSTEHAGGFVGNVIGVFVTGDNHDHYADFTDFRVQESK